MASPVALLVDADLILVCSVREEAVAAQPIQALIQAVVLASVMDLMEQKLSMVHQVNLLSTLRKGMAQQAELQVEVLELLAQTLGMVVLAGVAHAMELEAQVALALSQVAAAAVVVDQVARALQEQVEQAAVVA